MDWNRLFVISFHVRILIKFIQIDDINVSPIGNKIFSIKIQSKSTPFSAPNLIIPPSSISHSETEIFTAFSKAAEINLRDLNKNLRMPSCVSSSLVYESFSNLSKMKFKLITPSHLEQHLALWGINLQTVFLLCDIKMRFYCRFFSRLMCFFSFFNS